MANTPAPILERLLSFVEGVQQKSTKSNCLATDILDREVKTAACNFK